MPAKISKRDKVQKLPKCTNQLENNGRQIKLKKTFKNRRQQRTTNDTHLANNQTNENL